MTSSASEKEEAEPLTDAHETLKYPVASVTELIVKSLKSLASKRLLILKCPLIVEVESSIVLKNG